MKSSHNRYGGLSPCGILFLMTSVHVLFCTVPVAALRNTDERKPAISTTRLTGYRRGVVHFRGHTGDTVEVLATPISATRHFIYLLAPTGESVERLAVDGESTRRNSVALRSGGGSYALVLDGRSYVDIELHTDSVVFEPDREYVSLRLSSGEKRLFGFRTDTTGSTSRLYVTNHSSLVKGAAAEIAVIDTVRKDTATVSLPPITRNTLIQKSFGLAASDPRVEKIIERQKRMSMPSFKKACYSLPLSAAENRWRTLVLRVQEGQAQSGFWKKETENYYAPDGCVWYQPDFPPTKAELAVDCSRPIGTMPIVGSVWSWSAGQAIAAREYRRIGLASDKIFIPQGTCEVANDNEDPHVARMEGFRFARYLKPRVSAARQSKVIAKHLFVIMQRPEWLEKIASKDRKRAAEEIAEFSVAAAEYVVQELNVPPEEFFWQLANEPNHKLDIEEYVAILEAVGRRMKSHPDMRIRQIQIAAPSTGNPWDADDVVSWDWIARCLKRADRYVDVILWNQYAIESIHDTWRFGEAVGKTRSLSKDINPDSRSEEIVIGATNMQGGIFLQKYKHDGFYASLWWVSALINVSNTAEVSLINFFQLVDEGARTKGLYARGPRPKPVAEATAFFCQYTKKNILHSSSTHSGLEVLATSTLDSDTITAVILNKTRHRITVRGILRNGPWVDSTTVSHASRMDEASPMRSQEVTSSYRFTKATTFEGAFPPHSITALTIGGKTRQGVRGTP